MHCRFSHTLSVTQYPFSNCLVSWLGMVARVFIERAVCAVMYLRVSALWSSGLEAAEPLRNVTSSVRIKLDDHILDVGMVCKSVLPAQQHPVLFRKVRTASIPGTTPMIRSLPELGRIQQNSESYNAWRIPGADHKKHIYEPHKHSVD
jgi:hypothetical protein